MNSISQSFGSGLPNKSFETDDSLLDVHELEKCFLGARHFDGRPCEKRFLLLAKLMRFWVARARSERARDLRMHFTGFLRQKHLDERSS